jgi:hypothetical protein
LLDQVVAEGLQIRLRELREIVGVLRLRLHRLRPRRG